MNKTELLEKKGRLANEASKILADAQADGREALRAEEEAKFNAIHVDIEAITRHVKLINQQEDTERELSDTGERRSEATRPAGDVRITESRLSRGRVDYEQAFRGWALPDLERRAEHKAAAQRVGLDLGARSLTLQLPQRALRSLGRDDRRDWDEELRALSGPQNSTSVGGYTIQDAAMRELEIALLAYGGMRQVSTVLRTDTGGPLPIPTVNDTTNVGAIVGEGATTTAQDVVFAQLVLDAWKYSSKSILVSVELLQDSAINLPQYLGSALGTRIGRISNTHFTTGTGTSQPNGVVAAATFTTLATGQTTTILLSSLLTLYHAVDPAYRVNGKWMWADSTLAKLKQMNDTQGRPLWLPGLIDRAPDTLLGSPYVINQDMAAMTATAKSILFGDFSKYIIRDVREITLLRLDERYAEFHQVGFLAFARMDGDLLDAGTHPIRGIAMAAT